MSYDVLPEVKVQYVYWTNVPWERVSPDGTKDMVLMPFPMPDEWEKKLAAIAKPKCKHCYGRGCESLGIPRRMKDELGQPIDSRSIEICDCVPRDFEGRIAWRSCDGVDDGSPGGGESTSSDTDTAGTPSASIKSAIRAIEL